MILQANILCGLFAHNTIQILISAIQILQKHNWKVHVNIAGKIFCELLYATPNIHKYQILTYEGSFRSDEMKIIYTL